MRSDVEKKIDARVVAAFEEIVPGPDANARQKTLNEVRALVRAVWATKIQAALPKAQNNISDYFFEVELDQMLNETVDECYRMVSLIAERAEGKVRRG